MQLNTTLLCKCFSSRLWENSRYVTRQLDKIGPVLSDALVRSKITSFTALEAESPRNIELILNRQPPFGNRIRDQAVRLPRYELIVQHINEVRVEHSEVRVTVCSREPRGGAGRRHNPQTPLLQTHPRRR
nr:probable ATP-dependent DNA helicase HFM1 [Cherax quadricarinatus]